MTTPSPLPPPSERRLAIVVRGVVQGVGFRPFVYRTACEMRLGGWVRNAADNVRIEVQGPGASLDGFLDALRRGGPPPSHVGDVEVVEIPPLSTDDRAAVFEIRESEPCDLPRPTIPADLAVCDECLAEIGDATGRRHRYPFTNCTRCGPRWSIIERLPYDRSRTSMAGFTMCPACRAEYENPADRRFHAQPIACPHCGPSLALLDADGRALAAADDALTIAAQSLLGGRIVAMKGLGGFQLLVDAENEAAIARLRERKHRPDRPLAVMFPSLDDVRRHCEASDAEIHELASPRSPIVLLRRRDGSPLPSNLAPDNPYLGVMLPYTPLHSLLLTSVGRPVVCTSGNLSEEPMATTIEDAIERLGSIADVLLTHDRPIVRPVDDSIVRVTRHGVQVLRRARGFAPLPIVVETGVSGARTVLAVGGHLKNAVALALSNRLPGGGVTAEATVPIVLSAHVGDLDSARSVEVFRRAIDDLTRFFDAVPDVVVCDLHPDYASTRYAEQLATRWRVPLLRVQHHHAHVAACMAEHHLRGPVLGFAWDGTGYGADGTMWGGEVLCCENAAFRRAAHLRTFRLPGGDRAAREPRRSALGLLFELFGRQATEYAAGLFEPRELSFLMSMLESGKNCPTTSSMGRLFDGVAALCGLSKITTFEGQAAMALEFAADENCEESYPLVVTSDGILDWAPVVRGVLADRGAGASVSQISARFHNALADTAAVVATADGMPTAIVLTGGCFQNAILADRVQRRLATAGLQVYTHAQTPPGDGGIALGQAFLALQ